MSPSLALSTRFDFEHTMMADRTDKVGERRGDCYTAYIEPILHPSDLLVSSSQTIACTPSHRQ